MAKSKNDEYGLLDFDDQADEEVSLSIPENERLSVSLPEGEAERLREAAEADGVSLSKKIRESVHTRLYFENEADKGGEIFIRTKDNKLKKIRLD